MTADQLEDRIAKIERFLNDQVSYRPSIDSAEGKGYLLRSLSRIELAIFGDSNNMGIQTRVRFMWWVNYVIGGIMGSAITMLVQQFLKR